MVKEKRLAERREKNQTARICQFWSYIKKGFSRNNWYGIEKLKIDESYKEGFLLAIRLVASELKTIIDKKWMMQANYSNSLVRR